MKEKIEGIIHHASYDRSFNVDIQLKINEDMYKLYIPNAGSVYELQTNLNTNQIVRLEGILDEKQKIIKEPENIWVKVT
ncbi:hypothetical protein LCGC14_1027470 [marine sediment metagenome]|uniref:Uncharacterized protein n=1 Tax=marine sediment metagenome TaxID=412755 RepID=A0A0F9N089_9ZZZZ